MRHLFNYILSKKPAFRLSNGCNSWINYKETKFLATLPYQREAKQLSNLNNSPKWYSTNIYTPIAPVALTGTAVATDENPEFMAVFPDIVRDLTDAGRHLGTPDVSEWYAKVLQYNVQGGKNNRGLTLVTAYHVFSSPAQLTPENIRLAHVLGWCIEMLQAFLLILDDIMDEAETRRGRLCWHRVDETNNIAINDAVLLQHGIYDILKKYFRDKPYYLNLVEAFLDTTLKTGMGQSLDMLTCQNFQKNRKLDIFTMDRYRATVKYKTSYYSFHLPVALSMYMSGIYDPDKHRQVKLILLEMGHYFQIQDDYLDCFGDVDVTGKVGSDIQGGKCSWLIVVALQRASNQQKQTLERCYASEDPKDIETVKQIYKDIGLPSFFAVYEEVTYKSIADQIQQLSRGVPQDIFFKILEKIYKRSN